jgi:copper chaperone CopZ
MNILKSWHKVGQYRVIYQITEVAMKSIILGMISTDKGDIPIGEISDARTGMIHVRQRCSGCDKHIVKTAKSIEGVKNAKWNRDSNVLVVEFDAQKTSLRVIEMKIAEAGHDTPNHRGSIKYYSHIPKCCQYHEELGNEM